MNKLIFLISFLPVFGHAMEQSTSLSHRKRISVDLEGEKGFQEVHIDIKQGDTSDEESSTPTYHHQSFEELRKKQRSSPAKKIGSFFKFSAKTAIAVIKALL